MVRWYHGLILVVYFLFTVILLLQTVSQFRKIESLDIIGLRRGRTMKTVAHQLQIVRGVVVISLTTTVIALAALIPGCTHSPSSTSGETQTGNYAPACKTNPYLMKYNCSITRIQTAAENGGADAQYALGYMYYYGIGTVQDKQTASLWIQRSAAQGQPLAKKAWTLINTGTTFSDLHRAAAEGTDQGVTDVVTQQEPADVTQMNNKKPAAPISKYLPAYQSSQLEPKSQTQENESYTANNAPLTKYQNSLTKNTTVATTAPSKLPSKVITANHASSQQFNDDPRFANKASSNNPNNVVASQDNKKAAYTVQLMGSNKLSDLKLFIAENHLGVAAHYFETQMNNQPWYMLTYGQYSTAQQAKIALAALPRAAKVNHPWVKSFATVHAEVRLQKIIS